MPTNKITVLGTHQTFELPANISVHEHNGGWNINICDQDAKSRTNPLGIVFSVCTKALNATQVAQNLEKGLREIGAKPILAHA